MIFNNSKFNSHWPTKALNELGVFSRGKSKHRPRNDKRLFENGTIPLIQTGEVKQANIFINSHSSNYNDFGLAQSKLWPKGTLCITIAANIAETSILGYDMCFPDSIVGFNADGDECSEVFMHYIFSYIRESIQSRIQGSIQDNININYLTNLKFKIPEKKELKRIENTLFNIDAKIEVNNKINQELEAMAKTIYDYWFVQFDFPDANGKPYKSSGGNMVYHEEVKREIPVGWEVKELDEIIEIKRGKLVTAKTADLDGKYKVVSAGIDYSYLHSEYNRDKNTITVSGSGANAGFINFWRERIFANDCTTVRGKSDEETLVILQFLKLRQEYILNQARGSAQPHVYPKDLQSLKILISNVNLFEKYGKLVLPFNDRIAVNEKQNQKLAELRDWLLPMLMNGQVTVGEAKEKLGMVAEESIKYE